MNTENSKTNDSNKFIYQFTNKLNLKNSSNKNIGLVNLGIFIRGKTLNLHTTTINLKFQLQIEMMTLNCLMNHIQSQTFKIILSLSLNTL